MLKETGVKQNKLRNTDKPQAADTSNKHCSTFCQIIKEPLDLHQTLKSTP